jgi:hypothetical protein
MEHYVKVILAETEQDKTVIMKTKNCDTKVRMNVNDTMIKQMDKFIYFGSNIIPRGGGTHRVIGGDEKGTRCQGV